MSGTEVIIKMLADGRRLVHRTTKVPSEHVIYDDDGKPLVKVITRRRRRTGKRRRQR